MRLEVACSWNLRMGMGKRTTPQIVEGAHENSANPYHSHTFLMDFRLELSIPALEEGGVFPLGGNPKPG